MAEADEVVAMREGAKRLLKSALIARDGNPFDTDLAYKAVYKKKGYKRIEDEKLLARAILALHPDDAGEPVTTAWLGEKGFRSEDPDNPTFWVLSRPDGKTVVTIDCEDGSPCDLYLGDAEDYTPWPIDVHCRAQVYDVCRALGVPLPCGP